MVAELTGLKVKISCIPSPNKLRSHLLGFQHPQVGEGARGKVGVGSWGSQNRCFLAALPSHINLSLRKTRDWHWLLILLGLGGLQVCQLTQS